jgi:hypothetical protein
MNRNVFKNLTPARKQRKVTNITHSEARPIWFHCEGCGQPKQFTLRAARAICPDPECAHDNTVRYRAEMVKYEE